MVNHKDKEKIMRQDSQVEIPANEKWLFENATALQKVKKGLTDSSAEKIKSNGSFAKYADENKKNKK